MKRIFPMLIAASLLCAAGMHCRAQDTDAFKLEVSIPFAGKGLPRIHWLEKGQLVKPHFQVILRNISSKPQEIYDHAFPVIEITDAAGRTWTPHHWTGGWIGGGRSGDERTLQPGKALVFDIYFSRGDEPRDGDTYFHFTPASAGDKPVYPSGKVILWARCPLQMVDIDLLPNSVAARPVACIIDPP